MVTWQTHPRQSQARIGGHLDRIEAEFAAEQKIIRIEQVIMVKEIEKITSSTIVSDEIGGLVF